jgi:transposase
MFESRQKPRQTEMWVFTSELPEISAGTFYQKINETMEKLEVPRKVQELCKEAYADVGRGGRPGIDPVVYLKMLLVGFFENLGSERAIAARCADSLSIRSFLGYDLSENTPNHSSLSVIRKRLSTEVYQGIHKIMLGALHAHGLLKGKNLGIDASVIEANASLRNLVNRNTEEEYAEYVAKLAEEAGIDPKNAPEVRKFDKKRPGRTTSNKEWYNPHDPDAKVGPKKDKAIDMIYKPENVADLDTGAIVDVKVRCGDQADTTDMAVSIVDAVKTMVTASEELAEEDLGTAAIADCGYYSVKDVSVLQRLGVETIIPDPMEGKRRLDKLQINEREFIENAKEQTKSEKGKQLLRSRGMHLERAFCHILDHGGLRRTTLRGRINVEKRYIIGAFAFNLSLLMRTIFGIGTPKQFSSKNGVFGPSFCHLIVAIRCFRTLVLACKWRLFRLVDHPYLKIPRSWR